MKDELHVVLGASGAIGQAVISELKLKGLSIRAVYRTKRTAEIDAFNADLLNLNQTINAVKGAAYVYLCIGIPYKSKYWLSQWPKIMENVITACEKTRATLIFFDDVYMYGPSPLKVPFNESHNQSPVSEKGFARKKTSDLLMEAHNAGRIKAVIGRSADFYGPNAVNSSFYSGFLERMLLGKSPVSLSRINVKHTYAYTLDNGRALVALALDKETYGQVWHLPASEPVTIEEAVIKINHILCTNYKVLMIPGFIQPIIGLIVPIIKEAREMIYQFNNPYIIDFSKFKNHFPDFKVTSFDEGIKAMVNSFRKPI
ncbi:MAG: dependent epimerase/dehydratase family [Clostridiaceae bacterium]|nr:dependent epimerase/dehydratase family [Clostridiaceae bacterium]